MQLTSNLLFYILQIVHRQLYWSIGINLKSWYQIATSHTLQYFMVRKIAFLSIYGKYQNNFFSTPISHEPGPTHVKSVITKIVF